MERERERELFLLVESFARGRGGFHSLGFECRGWGKLIAR